jgi:hypothetical protein
MEGSYGRQKGSNNLFFSASLGFLACWRYFFLKNNNIGQILTTKQKKTA